jgi:hypothetical protein
MCVAMVVGSAWVIVVPAQWSLARWEPAGTCWQKTAILAVRAGLKSKIHWNSYLNETRLRKAVEQGGWRLVYWHATRKAGFDEVLWVVEAAG